MDKCHRTYHGQIWKYILEEEMWKVFILTRRSIHKNLFFNLQMKGIFYINICHHQPGLRLTV